MPPGLVPLYDRMLKQIEQLDRDNPDVCLIVLATATLVYRPLHLVELAAVSGLPEQVARDTRFVDGIVRLCGSFLTVREDYVTLVHQSAKDYLGGQAAEAIFPSGRETVHHTIFAQSVRVMVQTLRRNMYGLCTPGALIHEVKQPDPDPLAAVRYSCLYWVDHLQECSGDARDRDLQDGGEVDAFLRERYLYWLEALSLHNTPSLRPARYKHVSTAGSARIQQRFHRGSARRYMAIVFMVYGAKCVSIWRSSSCQESSKRDVRKCTTFSARGPRGYFRMRRGLAYCITASALLVL